MKVAKCVETYANGCSRQMCDVLSRSEIPGAKIPCIKYKMLGGT